MTSALQKFLARGKRGLSELLHGTEIHGPRPRIERLPNIGQPGQRLGGLLGDGGVSGAVGEHAQELAERYGTPDGHGGGGALWKWLGKHKGTAGLAAAVVGAGGTAAALHHREHDEGQGDDLAGYRGLGAEDDLEEGYRRHMDEDDGTLLNKRW